MVRWHSPRDAAVRAARRTLARQLGRPDRYHYRKHHPLDCGVPRCNMCHRDKFWGSRQPTWQELRSALKRIEGIAEMDSGVS